MIQRCVLFFLFILCLASCRDTEKGPDVSKVEVNLDFKRFDRDLFAIDTQQVMPSLNELGSRYPSFLPIFLGSILGLDSSNLETGVRAFIRLNDPIQDSVNDVFKNTASLEKELEQAFRHVKYYFPQFAVPRVLAITGPIDLLAQLSNGDLTPHFLGNDFLGLSLQFYLGRNYSLYQADYFITNVAPQYRSRRFSPEYLVPDAMKLVVDDLYPDRSAGKGLIIQMIERGKRWWLLDKLMPSAHDSLITGYTGNQLEFANKNEGLIWQQVITNEGNLYTIEPVAIQTYIGESPYTLSMGENSPGNIGAWIGWQIVKKFAEKNSELDPATLMNTDARKIFDEAGYKPK